MTVGYIHRIGTSSGPCTECRHEDCREQRREARQVCPLCHHQVGYDRSFRRTERGPVHASCAAEAEAA